MNTYVVCENEDFKKSLWGNLQHYYDHIKHNVVFISHYKNDFIESGKFLSSLEAKVLFDEVNVFHLNLKVYDNQKFLASFIQDAKKLQMVELLAGTAQPITWIIDNNLSNEEQQILNDLIVNSESYSLQVMVLTTQRTGIRDYRFRYHINYGGPIEWVFVNCWGGQGNLAWAAIKDALDSGYCLTEQYTKDLLMTSAAWGWGAMLDLVLPRISKLPGKKDFGENLIDRIIKNKHMRLMKNLLPYQAYFKEEEQLKIEGYYLEYLLSSDNKNR